MTRRPLPVAVLLLLAVATGCSDESPSGPTTAASPTTSAPASDAPDPGGAAATGLPDLDWSPDLDGGAPPQPCGEQVLCVGGSGDYDTIGDAVAAAPDGATVQVAEGTYDELVVVEDKELTLLGGFSSDFTDRGVEDHATTIDGQQEGTTVVLRRAGDSTLDGFHVVGGKAPLEDGSGSGSGVLVRHEDRPGVATISHNVIEDNDDGQDFNECDRCVFGGGIAADTWIDVTAVDPGSVGVVITDNIIRNNRAVMGAGLSTSLPSTIERNLITGNIGGGDHGGGMFLTGDGTVLRNNLISENRTGEQAGYGWGGGAIFAASPDTATPAITVEANRWVGNESPSHGPGLFIDEGATATITGDLFHDNVCHSQGVLYVDGGADHGSTAVIDHVTIVGNDCPPALGGAGVFAEGGSRFDLTDSVVVDNGGSSEIQQCNQCQDTPPADDSVVTQSIVGLVDGDATTDTLVGGEPTFAAPADGDYRLAPGSAGTGAGEDGTDLGAYGAP